MKSKYIIVTVEDLRVYREISEGLKLCGCREYENYIFWRQIDLKLAILYGNCHFEVLEEYLNNNSVFNRRYFIKRYAVTGVRTEYPTEEDLAECDLLITQDIREENYLNVKSANYFIGKVSDRATVIRVPNLFGCNLYFPQCKESDTEKIMRMHSDVIVENRLATKLKLWHMIGWEDENLERIIASGEVPITDAMVEMIENQEVYSAEDIWDKFNKEISKLQKRESVCDISISDYILNEYKKVKLFYDPHHPSKELIHEKGRRILSCLGIEIDEETPCKSALDSTEVFIYGCVKKALGMEFEEHLIRKNRYWGSFYQRPMDRKDYVEIYMYWNACND